MSIGIEHLPVMQLEPDKPLPKGVSFFEHARIKHIVLDGQSTRETTWLAPVVGRSPLGDVYIFTKEGDEGLFARVIKAENIRDYNIYRV